MAATAAQIALVRKWAGTNDADGLTYPDDTVADAIERYPVLDENGRKSYYYDYSTTPPTQTDNTAWIPTYDLHAAAAELWEEKAAALTGKFDISSDDQSLKRSQIYQQAMGQVRYHRARRLPATMTSHSLPRENPENEASWIANLPETTEDDFDDSV